MPTEQQELQLKVTLDDEASPQLEQIRAALAGLGGTGAGGGGANVSRLVGGMGDAEKAFGNLARGMLGVGRQAVDLAKAIGPMPVAMGALAYQTMRASEASESWASQMVRVANAARMAGTSVGDFRSVVDSLGRAGVSAETASAMMVKFNQAYGELVTMGSARREQLLNMAGPEFAGNMARAIRMIGTLRTDVEKLEAIRALGERVFQNEMTRSHDLALATYKRDQTYAAFGAEELAMVDRAIVANSKLTQENMNAEAKAMADVHAAHTEEQQTRDRIWQILRGSTATWDIWLTKQVTWIENILLKAAEEEEARSRGKSFSENFFYTPDFMRGAYGTNKNPLGSNLKPLGQAGDLGGHEAVETTDEHTTQLKRLTNNIMKMLADPKALGAIVVTPYQRGGKANWPQVAMVAEAGPEAVTDPFGTRIHDQPTIGMLGNDGPATVTPLSGRPTGNWPGMKLPDRNRNPGNIKRGPESERFGATGYDEQGHAIFPTWEAGNAAQGALLARRYAGLTIPQINKQYAEDPNWGKGVMRFGGYGPNEIADTSSAGIGRLQSAIQRQEGGHMPATGLGIAATPSGIAGSGFGQPINVPQADQSIRIPPAASLIDQYPDRGFHGGGGSSGGGGATANMPGAPYVPGGQSFENPHSRPTAGPTWYGLNALKAALSGGSTIQNTERIGKAIEGSGIREAFFPPKPIDAAEAQRRMGLPQIPAGGVHEDRGPLDTMMGNQLGVTTSGNIKIEHDNPPPGTEIETDGKVFEGATKETTSMPMFDTSDTARWRHPAEQEKERKREVEKAPYQPIDQLGIRG